MFDDVLWDEDLAAATTEATHAASRARDELSRHGAPLDELRACDEDARDGVESAWVRQAVRAATGRALGHRVSARSR